MHPLESGNLGVPAFLAKLWRLVEDKETNELISWSQDGKSFIIQNQAKFAKELLPLNYKHNNMASFIRQLNMYGFHKIASIDNGGLKFDKDEMEFSHPYFQKGHPYLLEHIKRKIANPKQAEADKTAASKVETMNRVLHEVKNMRGRQDSLDTRFCAMKSENEALWREVAILRQKHLKQQQIVNKLIQFLVTLVQPQRTGLGSGIGKRRYQLMINEAPQCKIKKSNNDGPIISELTEDLLDEVDSDLETDTMHYTNVESPDSKESKDDDDFDFDASDCNKCLEGLENIDEIDTEKMEECSKYLRKSARKRAKARASTSKASNLKDQKQFKDEAKVKEPVKVNQNQNQNQTSGKSLLLSSNNNNDNKSTPDITINILNDDAMTGMNDSNIPNAQTTATADPISPLITDNIIYDETSQNSNILDDDDDLFKLVEKKEEKPESDSMILTKYNPQSANDILTLQSIQDYSNHIDNVQSDLDSLKDLLHNDAYQLDTNQLLGNGPVYSMPYGYDLDTINKNADAVDAALLKITKELFGNDDLIGYEMSPANMELFATDDKDELASSRSEVIAYQPSPFNNSLDLNDFLQNVGDDKI